MRRTTFLACGFALALMGAILPLRAQETPAPSQSGEAAVAVQTTSASGDEAHFREDGLGQRNGLALELFRFMRSDATKNLKLDARFTTGGNGWLDLDVVGDHWRGGFHVIRVNRWSATSFANDLLPSGRPVAGLFPGTTHLAPFFGGSYPRQEVLRGEAFLTWRPNRANRLTLRVGASSRDGDRVPSIGGFSISPMGAAVFYTAGLEHTNSSSTWTKLQFKSQVGPVQFNAGTGFEHRNDHRWDTLPAYGPHSLLDLNQWSERNQVDTSWGRLNVLWKLGKWGVRSGVAYVNSSSKPGGGDRRITPEGSTVREGLNILSGNVDHRAISGSLGFDWRPVRTVSVAFAADTLHSYGNGQVDLALNGEPWTPANVTRDDIRVGGTARVTWRPGHSFLRLRLRDSNYKEVNTKERRGSFSRDVTRTINRFDARWDFSMPLAHGLTVDGWARYRDDDVSVDLTDLRFGYVAGDWERKEFSGSAAIRYRAGNLRSSLSAAAGHAAIDNGTPWYDPIFDPSLHLVPSSSDQRWRRVSGNLVWSLKRASFWADFGWLEYKFDFPTASLSGYAPLSEKVSGTVASVGGEAPLWERGTLTCQAQWINNSDVRDTDLVRASLRIEQGITKTWRVFARWGYWDLSNPIAGSSNYTINVVSVGVRATF